MLNKLKDYLYFNKSEAKGILILIVLIGIVISVQQVLVSQPYQSPSTSGKYERLKSQLDSLAALEVSKSRKNTKEKEEIFVLEKFNPNRLSIEDWVRTGLSLKQAQVVKNYQNKIGEFRSKQELQKVYVLKGDFYKRIEPFVLLPDSVSYTKSPQYKEKRKAKKSVRPLTKVDINLGDTSAFKKLYGIGSILANRIVKYRNKLGGFYSKKQLYEVYGLEAALEKLDTQLVISNIQVERININEATSESLKKHPYIEWKVANAIEKYRMQHGRYQEIDEILGLDLVGDSLLRKLRPYLKTEN